jgi:hypothetical protein
MLGLCCSEPGTMALARQKYWQIRTNLTTPLLYVYIVKLYPNDYK